MAKKTIVQGYPRITAKINKYQGCLDDSKLQQHDEKISVERLKEIVKESIGYANKKSSRDMLKVLNDTKDTDYGKIYKKLGNDLFRYFVKYCGDPATTAYTCLNKNYKVIGKEQFRNKAIQNQRMNSGWRYQYIAKGAAIETKRFISVSDIGSQESDFNAVIKLKDSDDTLSIYVSVKNRSNTMGGQDWPKAIRALEDIANNDKNRTGPYICVFAIAMEKGFRVIRTEKKTGQPYSNNTEIWMSDYMWPFFTNYSYEEIIKTVLNVLIDNKEQDDFVKDIPTEILEQFGKCCIEYGLLDKGGCFNDAGKLVKLFCGKAIKTPKLKNGNNDKKKNQTIIRKELK